MSASTISRSAPSHNGNGRSTARLVGERVSWRRRLTSVALFVAWCWGHARPAVMPTLGVGCFVAAAFTVSMLGGLLAAGFAVFFLEWRLDR